MSSRIADGVMAATQRLVNQAMSGEWADVPKTVEERRVLLGQLSASATPQDQQWLSALRQAMAESDAAVETMARADEVQMAVTAPAEMPAMSADSMLDMITRSR